MKKLSQQIDEKLLEYLDGTLPSAEKETLEKNLLTSPELSRRLEELRQVTFSLSNIRIEKPSASFTQKVMDHLDHYPVSRRVSIKNGILLLIGVLLAAGIASVLLAAGVFDSPGTINLNDLVNQNGFIKQSLPSIHFNGKLMVNIIILLNIAIAFLVLDRAILKPWFQQRARMHYYLRISDLNFPL